MDLSDAVCDDCLRGGERVPRGVGERDDFQAVEQGEFGEACGAGADAAGGGFGGAGAGDGDDAGG